MAKHLYLHVPFCKSICAYCDFCHYLYKEDQVNKWLDVLKEEMASYKIASSLETIYLGGGTPSVLSLKETEALLTLLHPYSKHLKEYTIEANPESITPDKIRLYKKYGIDRLSLGVESLDAGLLKLINRKHSVEDVYKAIDIIKEGGIDNISIDLIYSLPTQTLSTFMDTLKKALSLDIKHISLYSLTIEEGTLFKAKGYKSLDEDLEADMYEKAKDYLEANGYKQYEIANFAKDGYESKHNIGYWEYDDFYGLSLGASGKIDHRRYDNTRNFNDYLSKHYIAEYYDLSLEDEMFENVMMSLRMKKGLDLSRFKERYQKDFFKVYKEACDKHKDDLIVENDRVRVKDLEILNTILVDFLKD